MTFVLSCLMSATAAGKVSDERINDTLQSLLLFTFCMKGITGSGRFESRMRHYTMKLPTHVQDKTKTVTFTLGIQFSKE